MGEVMRKNDLIKILQSIEGNPEIKLWSGFVRDWQDIDKEVIKLPLVKHSFDNYINRLRMSGFAYTKKPRELSEDDMKQAKKDYDKQAWEINPFVKIQDIREGYYKQKNVYILQAKARGVATFDRQGGIEY